MCNLLSYQERLEYELMNGFDAFSHVRIKPPFRWRVTPSQAAPVIRKAEDKLQVDMLNYGFRHGRSGRTLMSRSETAAEKDMWREPLMKRRCLVAVHGFYDNELIMKGVNQPWYFQRKQAGLMVMAALWEEAPDAENFAIMSCEPNAVVRRVIDRMPVILPPEAWSLWLDEKTTYAQISALLIPSPADDMERWQVSREVNRGLDSPESIKPIRETQEGFDFL